MRHTYLQPKKINKNVLMFLHEFLWKGFLRTISLFSSSGNVFLHTW